MDQLPEFLVTPHNHFDPTWRRCFDRPADYKGARIRSYADIEEIVLSRSLEMSAKGYTQSEGQVAVWRKYLERHPDALAKMREEIRRGRICLTMAGETVQDSNLPTAEGLVRNFLVAMPSYREWCGEDHGGLKIAWVEDTFGSGPNYPQLLKNVGAETVWGTRYRACPDEVFVGIDGTKITCMDHISHAGIFSIVKYPPCPECKGWGCPRCDDTGMKHFPVITKALVAEKLDALIRQHLAPVETGSQKAEMPKSDRPDTLVQDHPALPSSSQQFPSPFIIGGEEAIPDPDVVDAVNEIAKNYRGRAKVRFATSTDVYLREKDRLDRVLQNHVTDEPHDLNPAMPGCYVNYFGISHTYKVVLELEEWLRRRVRLYYWKQWKQARTRRRNLIKLGADPAEVKLASRSRKGYWRMSSNRILQQALTNHWLEEHGAPNMRTLWIKLHYGPKARV